MQISERSGLRLSVAVLLIGIISLLALPAFAAGANLVQNGDLEQASAVATVPQGWDQDSWGTLTAAFTYPVAGNGSAKAAKVQITRYTLGDAKWAFNHIPVTAGATYTFSDTYTSGVTTEVTVEFKKSNGTYSYTLLGNPAATGSAWGTFTTPIKIPTGVVSMSVFHLIQSVGTLTIDNMSVVSGTSTPPLPPPAAPKPSISSFAANPVSIATGSSTLLSWGVTNASSTSINQSVGVVTGTSLTVSPAQTTQYVLTATNPAGSVSATTTVTVVSPPPTPIAKPTITSFSATPINIIAGSSTVLSWVVSNASSTSINQGVGTVTGTSRSVSPTLTTTYVLTATNPGGSVTATTTVTVTQPPPPAPKPAVASFISTPASILVGSSSVLSWTVSNASSTSINQGVGTVSGNNTSVGPTLTTTYVLTATNPAGSAFATTTVTVMQPPPPSSNLVQNGTLEAGSGSTPTGWQSDFWGTLSATFTYPVTGKDGGKAARVVVSNWTSGDAKWWFNHFNVSDTVIYKFTEDYMSTVIGNITVEFAMSNGSFQYQWVANTPVAAAWTPVSVEITVPRGAVSMSVLHALDKNGSLTIDNASVVALPANPFPQGMITIVMDDGLASQFTNARPILNTAGLKATYAIVTQGVRDFSGDTASMTWANIATLNTEGNEIDGHTRTHPDLSLMTLAQAQTEIKGSYDDLVAQGITPTTFVYPLGGVNPAVEQLVKNVGFAGARGSYWGLNSPTADKYSLYDMRVDKTTTVAAAKAWIDQAFADKRWLILELHDVLPSGGDDYAISNATFQAIVTYIKQKGIQTVTLQDGLALMQ